jgi:hypothetical protein
MPAPDSTLNVDQAEQKEKPTFPKKPSILMNKIETSKMPAVISIFGLELFRLNSCLATNIPSETDPWDICTQNVNSSNANVPKKVDPIDANLDKISGYLGKNNSVESQHIPSYEYKTRKEFEALYFPERLTKQERKLMIKVFRFVFGDSSSTVDRSVLLKLLTPYDKIPCKGEGQEQVWRLFHDCLEYRIKGASDLSVPADIKPEYTYGEDTYVLTIKGDEAEKRELLLQSIDPKVLTIKKEFEQKLQFTFADAEKIKAEDKLTKIDGNVIKELPSPDQGVKHVYLLVRKNKLKKPTKKSPGLNRELNLLAKTNPKINKEYEDKRLLKAQIYRMITILKEPRRSCVVFSDKGTEFYLSAYHTAILDLIRKTVTGFLEGKLPITEEEKRVHFEQLISDLRNLKEKKGDNTALYNQMLEVVKTMFDKLKGIDENLERVSLAGGPSPGGPSSSNPAVLGKLKGIDSNLSTLRNLLDEITPKQQGGVREEDSVEAEEEYERVYTSAMEHLNGLSKGAKEELLENVYEILGGKDLESSIEHAVTRKGFSLESTARRLHEIGPLTKQGKSFIRCVETLLEIKQGQHDMYEDPHLPPGEERYEYTMSKYPSLKKYIPKDVFRRKDFKDLSNLRRIYPYTDMIIEDIHILRKRPDPICLFYSGNLMKSGKKARTACKKIVDMVPQCEHLLEEVLEILSKQSGQEELTFREITLPKGFSVLAEAIRENLPPVPSLPITIHESCPKEYEKVMGDRPFLLIGTGTTLHGINDMEIDISDEIDDIRKGEISLGSVMFIYLYIKCDSHIDA